MTESSSMSWYFRKMGKDEISSDPRDAEFFVEAEDSSKLVREAIQNSLDAKLPNEEPVTLSIKLIRKNRIESSNDYVSGLEEHLKITTPESSMMEEPMDYLVIEDFNTRGLEGETEQYEDAETEQKNDFFYFWRNRGRSEKAEEARGRWGLGKLVFPHSSKINTFFGYTVRAHDKRHLLMGLCDLKIHQFQRQRYDSTAFYCKFIDGLQMPTEDAEEIELFKKTFNLERKDESGFSIVVVYPNETIKIDDLLVACIDHYYFPLLSGELKIVLSDEEKRYPLDADAIKSQIDSLGDEVKPLKAKFDFIDWILANDEGELVRINNANSAGKPPQWSPELIPVEHIDELKEKFVENSRLGIRVPLTLLKKTGQKFKTHFDVFMEKDPTLKSSSDIAFIREGLTISKVGADRIRSKGIRAQVLVRHPAISEFLGDAENPAHTEWQQKQPKIKEKYEKGYSTVMFVKNSVNKLIEYLSPTIGGRDDTLLKDYFWFEKKQELAKKKKKKGKKRKKKGDTSSKPEVDIDRKSILDFKILKYDDGFKLLPKEERAIPKEIRIKVAYDLESGNSFTNYSEFDFRLDELPIVVSSKNAEVEYGTKDDLEGNQMIVFPNDKFEVEVIGFDMKSNLLIEARRQ